MIRKYRLGDPIHTNAVTADIAISDEIPDLFRVRPDGGFRCDLTLEENDIVYGLGGTNRGINKRGWLYETWNSDEPLHSEEKHSLFASQPFILISGSAHTGYFFDYPGKLTFDVGYTRRDLLNVTSEEANLDIYVITGERDEDVVRQFRAAIGRSYIPPKAAFGYTMSRWGYEKPDDFREVVRRHREAHVPLDNICMDIDYMDSYKDFTVNAKNFPDFPAFVREMKDHDIRLYPIIDAGVKIDNDYPFFKEGLEQDAFCKREDGSYFTLAVWPGWTHFPDYLNTNARKWFGSGYKFLLDAGIEGFWNDMNEPAIFYSEEGVAEMKQKLQSWIDGKTALPAESLSSTMLSLTGNLEDYRRFYHNMDGKIVRHDKVHNLYGFNMVRAGSEAFKKYAPGKRVMLISRSSYTGSHRYAGNWMGDNRSWWSHLLMNFKMLPAMNMSGYLYTGCDGGGLMGDVTRELMLRFLAMNLYMPFMRNHSAKGTRRQEFWQFDAPDDFRAIINVRYRLLPYLYSEYMKAALNDQMMFPPLGFVYPHDERARRVEDQLMLGGEVMIAPVFEQNAVGRYVYLPEDMRMVKFLPDGGIEETPMGKGDHYIDVALNEVALFVRSGKCVPIAEAAETVGAIDYRSIRMVGTKGAEYALYDDDGVTPICDDAVETHITLMKCE